jgi:serine/threonine-protein kinase
MPSPRELQPHLSAAVNQAVMRGMAVEAKFRPPTVAAWLKLLPAAGAIPQPQYIPTSAVKTINLSAQEYSQKQTVPPTKVKLNPPEIPEKQNTPFTVKKVPPKVMIGTGVAVLAASLGFGVTKMISTPTPQSSPQPVVEQPTNNTSATVEGISTPSNSPTPENTISAPKSDSTQVEAATTYTPRKRRRRVYSEENTTTSSSSSRRNNSRNTEESNSTKNTGESRRNSGTSTTKNGNTQNSTPTTGSDDLINTLRKVRDTRSSKPSENNKSSESKSSPPNPVVVPTESKRSRQPTSDGIVVPTQETQERSSADVQNSSPETKTESSPTSSDN